MSKATVTKWLGVIQKQNFLVTPMYKLYKREDGTKCEAENKLVGQDRYTKPCFWTAWGAIRSFYVIEAICVL